MYYYYIAANKEALQQDLMQIPKIAVCVCLFLHILLSPSPFIFYLFESQDDILWNNFKETEMHFEMNAMHDDRKNGSLRSVTI